jgi:hypothetical protein
MLSVEEIGKSRRLRFCTGIVQSAECEFDVAIIAAFVGLNGEFSPTSPTSPFFPYISQKEIETSNF